MTTVAFEKEVFLKALIARLPKRLFEVLNLRKISGYLANIDKWKEKVEKNTQLSFWWKAKSSSYEICLRRFHMLVSCS